MKYVLKYVLLIFLISVEIVASLDLSEEEKYTTKYDDIDIDSVIRNDRLLNNYIGCLLERNSCTPDAAELKKNLPNALSTNCSACSEPQKRMADKFSHHVIDNKPDEWKLLETKYDPTGYYRKLYLQDKPLKEETA